MKASARTLLCLSLPTTKKGNDWHFGTNAHIGVDAESSLTHTLMTTPANTADMNVAHELLHGEEKLAFGDARYQGVDMCDAQKNVKARWHVAMRPGKRRGLPNDPMSRILEELEQLKASERSGQGRAPVSHHQESVWSEKGSQPGTRQEHRTALHAVRSGESGDRREKAWYDSRPNCVLIFQDGAKYHEKSRITMVFGSEIAETCTFQSSE